MTWVGYGTITQHAVLQLHGGWCPVMMGKVPRILSGVGYAYRWCSHPLRTYLVGVVLVVDAGGHVSKQLQEGLPLCLAWRCSQGAAPGEACTRRVWVWCWHDAGVMLDPC